MASRPYIDLWDCGMFSIGPWCDRILRRHLPYLFANWFAEGTQSSTFTYYPNKVRMILQSFEILTLGVFWLVAAVVFWRNQVVRGTLYFLIGLIAMGGLKLTGVLLRSIGW